MASVRIAIIPEGIREILLSDPVGDYLEAIAEKDAAKARNLAPVGPAPLHYRDNIEVRRVKHKDRVVAQVWATVDYAVFVEAHTGTLARSL